MRRASLALCASVALAWLAAPAAAQPAASDADLARAKELYDEGSREYAAAHYDRAIELFLGAYGLSGHPAILFNVAQAYRLHGPGSCGQALSYYRRALAEEPEAANRAEIEERIGEMERCVAQQPAPRATPTPPVRTAEPAPSTGRATPAPVAGVADDRAGTGRPVGPIVTVAIGGAAALTGALIYWQARVKYDEVESTCPCEPGTFDGWETATDASYVLMAAGGLAVAGGLVWWWRESSRGRRPTPRLGLVPTAGGALWTAAF